MKKQIKKRVDIIKIKLCKEGSILYEPRKITSPKDAAKLAINFLGDLDREEFIVISLDIKNQPLTINLVSIGTLNSNLIHPREVMKSAILSNAANIIVAHNHPSGVLEPSKEDIAITNRLKESGKIIGIELLDHLIVSNEDYISLKERGVI